MSTEKLTTYTSDLLSFNKHFMSVVRTQKTSDTVTNTKAVNLLHNIDIALTNQINELEKFDNLIEDSRFEDFKNKTASVFGSIAGTINSLREDPVSKILRDDYTALSMLASGYTMLYTAALAYDMEELATFSYDSLTTIAQLITETSQTIPYLVAEELMEDSEKATGIAERALEQTQKAWSLDNMLEEA